MQQPDVTEVYTDSRGPDMSKTDPKTVVRTLTVVGLSLLASCAAQDPLEFRPRPDMTEVARQLNCPSSTKATCIERVGRPYACYCMDEDALRKILEPEKY
jgi:hypothetical protein